MQSNSPPHAPLRVTMCRFVKGKFQQEIRSIHDTQYLAISHVWGEGATWQRILNSDFDILVTAEKAAFISEKLPAIVGDRYFWMDVLCVVQSNKEARVAVTQHIPTIFRGALKTILIRDGNGFQRCCFNIMKLPEDLSLRPELFQRFSAHYNANHQGEDFLEGSLSRLWVFQELMLSDKIQFVSGGGQRATSACHTPTEETYLQLKGILHSLTRMTYSWVGYCFDRHFLDEESEDPSGLYSKFIEAFCTCDTVSRPQTTDRLPAFPTKAHLQFQITSPRRTTKARDFILAVMPQYSFYTVPYNAKSMTFTELFVDCYQQLNDATNLTPLLTITPPRLSPYSSSAIHEVGAFLSETTSAWALCPSTDVIPEPVYLADFTQLLFGPSVSAKFIVRSVQVTRTESLSLFDALELIQNSRRRSRTTWQFADILDFGQWNRHAIDQIPGAGSNTEIEILFQSLRNSATMPVLACTALTEQAVANNSRMLAFIRMAALITCGLPLSAFQWSKCAFTPVVITVGEERFLGLADQSIFEYEQYSFYLVEAEPYLDWIRRKRYVLVAWRKSEMGPGEIVPCFFPPDTTVDLNNDGP